MAYDFTAASSQYLSASAPINGNTFPFTMACWFRPSNVTTTYILISLSSTSADYVGLVAEGGRADDPVRAFQTSEATEARTTTGYTANNWHHACAVFTSNASRTVYLDGGGSATNTVQESRNTNASDFLISARRFNGALGSYFDGDLAEVGIWNAALTAAEIASLAKGMTCDKVRPQSLVFYAPLVRDLQDVRGGRTITNNNTATVANHPRVYA